MRTFFIAIVVVAVGYLGWVFYNSSRATTQPAPATQETMSAPEGTPATNPPSSIPAARRDVSPRSVPPRAASPQTAAPGVFYALERVSVKTATGVKALHPGEEVRLMYRYKDGSMLVTTGHDEFVLKPSLLTKDREFAARIAPR